VQVKFSRFIAVPDNQTMPLPCLWRYRFGDEGNAAIRSPALAALLSEVATANTAPKSHPATTTTAKTMTITNKMPQRGIGVLFSAAVCASLSKVKQTLRARASMSAYDPKQTSPEWWTAGARSLELYEKFQAACGPRRRYQ
jgi:hypothetical protein